jgi:hypothetical protein
LLNKADNWRRMGRPTGICECTFPLKTSIRRTANVTRSAYIKSRLSSTQTAGDEPLEAPIKNTSATSASTATKFSCQVASYERIQEIDLGPASTAWNVQRTQEIQLRIKAGLPAEAGPRVKPPRLRKGMGPDGTPWRVRKPRQRDESEVLRETLVEEILKESGLNMYADVSSNGKRADTGGAEDETLAAEFQRDFTEQMAQRRRPKVAPVPQRPDRTSAVDKKKEKRKGLKLGGSRSARAAMHKKQSGH